MAQLVEIRVELPTFSQNFNVQVPDSGTVLDVKREISRVCVGAPRVEGQRVIWRGRPLLDDERIEELWKSPEEPRIVHLAVHPSAWSSTPPEVAPPATATPLSFPAPSFTSQPTPRPVIRPLSYVTARHEQALSALEQSPVPHLEAEILALRTTAVQIVENHGWAWPTLLDEEFPVSEPGGVKYERVVIDAHTYLRLVEPADQPTAIQVHALKVIALTFSILTIPPPPPTQTRVVTASQPLPHLQAILQQLNPALRNAINLNLAENVRQAPPPPPVEIPLRPLLLPLFLLMLRTAILLYFFAPARKPVFGILIVAWMLYEVWRPIREGLNRAARAVEQEQQQQQNPAVPAGAQPPAQPAQDAAQPPPVAGGANLNPPLPRRRRAAARPGGGAANEFDQQVEAIFESLGNVNMDNEEDMFRRGLPEPSFGSKVITFFTLFFATLHPAVWNRRRAVLRQRETNIRMDANARAAELDATSEDADTRARLERQQRLISEHNERPKWIRDYIGRVVDGAWVDEAD